MQQPLSFCQNYSGPYPPASEIGSCHDLRPDRRHLYANPPQLSPGGKSPVDDSAHLDHRAGGSGAHAFVVFYAALVVHPVLSGNGMVFGL